MSNVRLTFDDYVPAAVITKDDKYAILFTEPEDSDDKDDDTFELDLNNSEIPIKRSANILPWKYPKSLIAFMMGDVDHSDIIINGYLRRCWKTNDFNNLDELPYELIGIIIQYFTVEYVHVARQFQGHHYHANTSPGYLVRLLMIMLNCGFFCYNELYQIRVFFQFISCTQRFV